MAPKSSDGGSSRDPELMETSTGVALSLVGETPNPDDSGESEQTADQEEGVEDELEEESDGESYKSDEKNSEPEWGYDSFDERQYDSSDLIEFSDKEYEEQYRHYTRQLIETKGFFETSDKFPLYIYYSGVGSLGDLDKPAMLGLTTREVCEKLTCLCLQRYNEDENKNVKLDHILRANFDPSSMTKFYITFAARESESPDAPLVEYQAKAAWSVTHKTYPILCRPSPPTKKGN